MSQLSVFSQEFCVESLKNSDAICFSDWNFYLRSTKLLLLVGAVVGFAGSIFEILCSMDLILPSLLSLLSTWSKVSVLKPLSDEMFELSMVRFF